MLAQFKCLKCDYAWEQSTKHAQCPRCHHDYVKLINFEQLREEWNNKRKQEGLEPI